MLNVIPMVPTKNVVVEYTQKEMRKKFRLFTTKNRQKKTVMQEMRGKKNYKACGRHVDRSKFLLIRNYFKYKWVKLFIQKTKIGRMAKNT